jgi:hypothetical protein
MLAMTQNTINLRIAAVKLISIALSVYVIGLAATYILEGRIHLFQKVDPIGRMTYVVIGSIAIGTVASTIAIRYLIRAQLVKLERELYSRYYDKHCSLASK